MEESLFSYRLAVRYVGDVDEPLAELFRYNKWANSTLLEACRRLSDEQLDMPSVNGSGRIRELLVHIVGG
jgi:uncharacterized damage-inducible protein DinB